MGHEVYPRQAQEKRVELGFPIPIEHQQSEENEIEYKLAEGLKDC